MRATERLLNKVMQLAAADRDALGLYLESVMEGVRGTEQPSLREAIELRKLLAREPLVQEVIRLRTAQHKQQSVEEENELANDMAEALDALKAWKP